MTATQVASGVAVALELSRELADALPEGLDFELLGVASGLLISHNALKLRDPARRP